MLNRTYVHVTRNVMRWSLRSGRGQIYERDIQALLDLISPRQ